MNDDDLSTQPGRRSDEPPYERAGRILLECEGLSGAELDAFLVEQAQGDAELLALLRELAPDLAAAESFLADAPGRVLRERLDARLVSGETMAGHEPGAELGSFRLLRRIAQGGMGTVYEAEQSSPKRRVALKVIAPGMASPAVLQRFRREGEVLARLSHPGVAKVLEVSGPDAEQPWFAMELVDGLRLTDHAETHGLSTHERLALLAATCDAVAHAHSRGVLHRDLKPSNVLVDGSGQPRILDFGVARVTGLESRASSLLTRTGDLLGTLAYMSPEQSWGRQDAIDERTDVYSLGVMGFELLTGQLPRRLDGLAVGEALHVLREAEPDRADSIDPRLAGDVANILAKALESEPARRYPSASALAADLRRSMRHEPIVARPPSVAYRITKFLRRHRTLALTTSVAFFALAVVTALAVKSAFDAAEARGVAERETYRAQLAAAASDLDLGRAPAAARLLESVPQAARGWEWDVLRARAGGPSASRSLPGVLGLAMAAEGDSIHVLARSEGRLRHLTLNSTDLAVKGEQDLSSDPLGVPPALRPLVVAELLAEESPLGLSRPPAARPGAAAVSRDGRRALLSRRSGGTAVFDLESGVALADGPPSGWRSFDGSAGRIAWSVVSSAGVMDALTGRTVFEQKQSELKASASQGASDEGFMSHAFAADGRSLLVASYGSPATLRRFDASTGELFDEIHVQATTSWGEDRWAVASGSPRVAWTAGDGAVHVFDAALERELGAVYLRSRRPLAGLALDAAGTRLVGFEPDAVHAWDLSAALLPRVLPVHGSYTYSVAYSADGLRFVTAGWDNFVRAWDGESGELRLEIAIAQGPNGEDTRPTDAVFSVDGESLLTLTTGGRLDVHDSRTGSLLRRQVVAPGLGTATLSLDPGGEFVALSANSGGGAGVVLRLADLTRAIDLGDCVGPLAWSPVDRVLAAARSGGGGVLVDWESGARSVLELPGADPKAKKLNWNASGRRLAALLADGSVLVLDGTSGRRLATIRSADGGTIYDAVISRDGRRLVTGSEDGVVRVWDAERAELLASWAGHGLYVHDLAFSPDGAVLLSASGDRTVRRWDGRTAETRNGILARHAELWRAARERIELLAAEGADPQDLLRRLRADERLPPAERDAALALAGRRARGQ